MSKPYVKWSTLILGHYGSFWFIMDPFG